MHNFKHFNVDNNFKNILVHNKYYTFLQILFVEMYSINYN